MGIKDFTSVLIHVSCFEVLWMVGDWEYTAGYSLDARHWDLWAWIMRDGTGRAGHSMDMFPVLLLGELALSNPFSSV